VAGTADRPIFIAYIIYYGVIALFAAQAIFIGRRAGCYSVCWMAPFMITGRKLRNLAGWPSLRLQASPERCSNCKTCTTNCPMSLNVNGMVRAGQMEHSECILCGSCVDNCAKKAIAYRFGPGGGKRVTTKGHEGAQRGGPYDGIVCWRCSDGYHAHHVHAR
jgi:polyferredoxin